MNPLEIATLVVCAFAFGLIMGIVGAWDALARFHAVLHEVEDESAQR